MGSWLEGNREKVMWALIFLLLIQQVMEVPIVIVAEVFVFTPLTVMVLVLAVSNFMKRPEKDEVIRWLIATTLAGVIPLALAGIWFLIWKYLLPII